MLLFGRGRRGEDLGHVQLHGELRRRVLGRLGLHQDLRVHVRVPIVDAGQRFHEQHVLFGRAEHLLQALGVVLRRRGGVRKVVLVAGGPVPEDGHHLEVIELQVKLQYLRDDGEVEAVGVGVLRPYPRVGDGDDLAIGLLLCALGRLHQGLGEMALELLAAGDDALVLKEVDEPPRINQRHLAAPRLFPEVEHALVRGLEGLLLVLLLLVVLDVLPHLVRRDEAVAVLRLVELRLLELAPEERPGRCLVYGMVRDAGSAAHGGGAPVMRLREEGRCAGVLVVKASK